MEEEIIGVYFDNHNYGGRVDFVGLYQTDLGCIRYVIIKGKKYLCGIDAFKLLDLSTKNLGRNTRLAVNDIMSLTKGFNSTNPFFEDELYFYVPIEIIHPGNRGMVKQINYTLFISESIVNCIIMRTRRRKNFGYKLGIVQRLYEYQNLKNDYR